MTIADPPEKFSVSPDGTIAGRNGEYTKYLADMAGVYRDTAAYEAQLAERGGDTVVYGVHSHNYSDQTGELTIGTSTLQPGRYGDEFAVTRGHLHGLADRAELYYCLSGRGVMLLETVDGRCRAVELTPGEACNVPGHWLHRSVNVGDEPFVTLFCYASDAGQDYSIIAEAGGMKSLVVSDGTGGWTLTDNPDHVGYRTTG